MENKKCIAVDLGRSYIDYNYIDELCLKTFPDEALNAVQAFKNITNADIFDPGAENKGFSNHVGWIEPVKYTTAPEAGDLAFLEKAAAEIKAKSNALLFIGSASAYLAVKAGVDFLAKDKPIEIIFAGELSEAAYNRTAEKLKGRKFSICAIEDKEMPHGAFIAISNIKDAEKIYAFSNNKESAFCAWAKNNGAEVFIQKPEFTGPAIVLSPGALLPLASVGIDIKALIEGATLEDMPDMESFVPAGCAGAGATREAFIPLSSLNIKNYSAARLILKEKGCNAELLVYTDPLLAGFTKWIKYISMYLAGAAAIHTDAVDLSNNAYTLENYAGKGKGFFETFIHIGHLGRYNIDDLKAPADLDAAGAFLMTESMQNQRKMGVPIMRIDIPEVSPYLYGQMISMFSRAFSIMDIWESPEEWHSYNS